ncbi:sugar ABC transporter ATP-binding protein [Pseudoroseicyclus sp. CXY001]|uniref:sugar ABC transporter ATP-binding protein n=1 Tax=Pseudoroseicyclus sp. CXY001 TaxID=3242492 RepID=UPI003570FDAF
MAGLSQPTVMPIVTMTGIDKRFGGIQSLRGVDLDLRPGEIHALIGENGAGKSTLGKVLGGYHPRDGGEIIVAGEPVGPGWSPRRALDAGIAMIQQELAMVPGLSVQDNVFLGIETRRLGVLARDNAARYRELEARTGYGIPGEARLGDLRVADRQKVEILRALAREARVIIMDEPTSSLSASDIERLHGTMRALREAGHTIVYVTHFLEHVLDVTDRITVLRNGEKVTTVETAGQSRKGLVEAMIGHSVDVSYPERPPLPARTTPAVLDVAGLETDTGVRGVDFSIRPGEILGLIGLVGSGRSEIARAVAGVDPVRAGAVRLDGEPITGLSQREIIRRRLVLVPEERRAQGLVMTAPVQDNMSLPHLKLYSHLGVISPARERARVAELMDRLNVVPRRPRQKVSTLSGGNQQKVLIGKWLMAEPRVVILDEPTKGVDVGARRMINETIMALAEAGTAILLISSEIEEVLGLAHRAYLVNDGRFLQEVACDTADGDAILHRLFETEDTKATA